MKHTDSSLHHVVGPGWQILGELELTVNPDADHTTSKWMAVMLNPLALGDDFVNKVLKSAREAMTRAMQVADTNRFEHLHLIVFVPAEPASQRQSWGFFRIERVGGEGGQLNPDHTIEFYLYMEG
jgi:hypothetical protein